MHPASDNEEAFLSCMLLAPDIVFRTSLGETHFFDGQHRRIFRAMKQCADKSIAIDYISIGDVDPEIDKKYLAQISERVPSGANWPYYQGKIIDAYPRKEARGQALKAYKAARRKGITAETILERLDTYKARLDRDGTDRKYMRLPATFLHNLDDYEHPEPVKPTAPPEREIETVTVPPEIMAAILRSQQPVNKTGGDDESCK